MTRVMVCLWFGFSGLTSAFPEVAMKRGDLVVRRASYSLHSMMVEGLLRYQRNLHQPLEFLLIIVRRIVLSRIFKLHADDSPAEEIANATQLQGPYLPIAREKPTVELVKVTDELKSFKAYDKLHVERMNTRHIGAKLKKVLEF
ncbi:unnamed protein product [Malus baccata var. baccata]